MFVGWLCVMQYKSGDVNRLHPVCIISIKAGRKVHSIRLNVSTLSHFMSRRLMPNINHHAGPTSCLATAEYNFISVVRMCILSVTDVAFLKIYIKASKCVSRNEADCRLIFSIGSDMPKKIFWNFEFLIIT